MIKSKYFNQQINQFRIQVHSRPQLAGVHSLFPKPLHSHWDHVSYRVHQLKICRYLRLNCQIACQIGAVQNCHRHRSSNHLLDVWVIAPVLQDLKIELFLKSMEIGDYSTCLIFAGGKFQLTMCRYCRRWETDPVFPQGLIINGSRVDLSTCLDNLTCA